MAESEDLRELKNLGKTARMPDDACTGLIIVIVLIGVMAYLLYMFRKICWKETNPVVEDDSKRIIGSWADLTVEEEQALLQELEIQVTSTGARFHYRLCGNTARPGVRNLTVCQTCLGKRVHQHNP